VSCRLILIGKHSKHLDADISTDGKKLVVAVNKTKLNGMDLTDITVQISDLSATKLDVEVIGKINTQSEQLMQFLASAPARYYG